MCGATVATVAVGVATSVASSEIESGINGGGGGSSAPVNGGSSGSSSSGGGGLNVQQTQYAYYGPHQSTTPMAGKEAPNPTQMTAQKPLQAQAASPRATPTQAVGTDQAKNDYNNVWADRLSRYLDYNTRNLG